MSRSDSPKPGQFHDYVTVTEASSLMEAELLKGLLESYEIPAIVGGEASEVLGLGGSVFGQGVPVLVPDELLEDARQVLADRDQPKVADKDKEDESADSGEAGDPEAEDPEGETSPS